MKIKLVILTALIAMIVSFLTCSCTRSESVNTLNAEATVRQYLDEITVLRDLVYKDLPAGDTIKITKESARYLKAKKGIISLIWDSGNARADKFRKNTFTGISLIMTSARYEIIDQTILDNKAVISVVFYGAKILGQNLGAVGSDQSKPLKYQLIKDKNEWKLKDINDILSKQGL